MAAVQALVLVDVQAAFVAGQQAVPDAESLIGSVTGLLARARSASSLVVHLQNDGEVGAVDEPGLPGWELHLQPGPGERVIRKTGDDGFQGTTLGRVLIVHRVSRLAIAGVLSEMCVSATARTALDRGFGVVLPHDAHATYGLAAEPGFGPAVPAALVARVTEHALGNQIELAATAADVVFTAAALLTGRVGRGYGQPRGGHPQLPQSGCAVRWWRPWLGALDRGRLHGHGVGICTPTWAQSARRRVKATGAMPV
jgi:nicotinamidase-related amidase